MGPPRVPKFRVPAALVSPAALCLVGGMLYVFTLDFSSEDELNANIKKEFPDVVRTSHEVDERMREFFKRVNADDPREEERMRNLLNQGKGSHYKPKRRHATTQDIQDFGFVPQSASVLPPSQAQSQSQPPSSVDKTKAVVSGSMPANTHTGSVAESAGGDKKGTGEPDKSGGGARSSEPRKKGWFW